MNKKTKLFSLSAVAFMSVALSSCDLFEKENLIVSFKTNNSEMSVSADEILARYKDTVGGTEAYYNAIYEVVIRQEMNAAKHSAKKAELVKKATTKVDDAKEEAENNAETNKTNYDDELETILKGKGCEDLKDLQSYFEADLFKEYLEDDFYDKYMDNLLKGDPIEINGTTINVNSYLNDVLPYHVKHILLKVSADSNDYVTGTISDKEAMNISSLIHRLGNVSASTETFGQIAFTASEDTGSAANYGDLGIMSKNTSYVNEFKLGVYTYDSLFNETLNESVTKRLGLVNNNELSEQQASLEEIGLTAIPYGAADLLAEYANVTHDKDGELVNNGTASYYPRNVIFNQFFNKHNVGYITPQKLDPEGKVVPMDNDEIPSAFQVCKELNDQKVLCDENGNPILVVRAGTGSDDSGYQGIHFIVVQRDALIETEDGTTLEEYYTTELPGSEDFPKNIDGEEKVVYVNYIKNSKKEYLTRSDKLKEEIKTADNSINIKMYQYFFKSANATIKDKQVATNIDTYIDSQFVSADITDTNKENDTWKAYVRMLERQEDVRDQRLIPTTCAVNFKGQPEELFGKDGLCYYVEK